MIFVRTERLFVNLSVEAKQCILLNATNVLHYASIWLDLPIQIQIINPSICKKKWWILASSCDCLCQLWVEDFTPVLGESNHPWRKPKLKKAEKNSSSLNFSCPWFHGSSRSCFCWCHVHAICLRWFYWIALFLYFIAAKFLTILYNLGESYHTLAESTLWYPSGSSSSGPSAACVASS